METILLVDDDDQVLAMIRDMLELSGYKVLAAASGERALKVEAAHAEDIHLLLTDIVMPGLTGPELARRLKERRPRMKVMYMSGFTLLDIQNHRIDLDPGVFLLVKPFSRDSLTRKVSEALAPYPRFHRPRGAEEPRPAKRE